MKRGRGRFLKCGDWVEVRSASEILATLDEDGELESLPFMPEMLKLCGRRFQVYKRAEKTCDRIEKKGLRRLNGAVHLPEVRCDGASHGDCQAGCLLIWKEAWLEPVDGPATGEAARAPAEPPRDERVERLHVATRRSPREDEPAGDYYRCQATELNRASTPLPYSDLRQYWRDVRSGNVRLRTVLWWAVTVALDAVQRIPKTYRLVEFLRGPFREPRVEGRAVKTPKLELHLEPGELVRVKPLQEITATLDPRLRNRGLSFDREMVKYCGRTHRVLRRVDRCIDEPTGRMLHMKGDCIILDKVVCEGTYHGFCPKEIYPYWREIWLERVNE